MKKKNWLHTILDAATLCKGKITLSILFAIISVFGGFVPYIGVYHMLCIFLEGTPTIEKILMWSGVCLVGYVIKLLFYGISTTLAHISAYTILEQIRLKIMEKMMKAPLGVILNETSGKLKNIIVDRVETMELPLAHMIPEGISNFLLPVGVFVYLFFIDFRMALAALATVPMPAVIFMVMMRNFNKQYTDYMEASNHVNSVIVEYVGGIEIIKAFGQSTDSYKKFATAVNSFKDYTLAWFQSTWKSMNFIMALLPSALVGTIPVGIWLYLEGSLTVAEFAICLILSLGIITPLMWFTTAINDIKMIEYAVNDASKLLDLEELPNSDTPIVLQSYDVSLSNVSFSYGGKNGQENALTHVSISIPQGSFSALVGPSGGGKSTVARLITRFWDVGSGMIKIGGVDIRKIPFSQLTAMISFVTQDNFLFNCSLLENIRLGNPKATDEQVYESARQAQCDEFIRKLEKGYKTTAGEAGGRLSGGERQRIAIARAMLKNAPIVILDEATAFTDPENEDKLQKSISALTKGKTLIVIAHRLSTVKDADQIIVMEKGRVIRKGKQQELIKSCALYRDMWETHIGTKKWAAGSGGKENAYV
ncbi:MAG: ABC transporter ATP-binding protein/permease [Anaeromicrobium sp.]|jgi:ATP-binding cassette subfamily B protein|uniref:ABC transporter ATP-binding protein n=1 Tax=Anaeromicrobium sp. TaxID=1929132 RepID=UPI0025DFE357|nr:ABC transporter ATP-binding protein [Anaeromicrobium sp.]MCT4596052.1 ABC transporter ATP-binding protein/permease [Anaeromicrobium sp.]